MTAVVKNKFNQFFSSDSKANAVWLLLDRIFRLLLLLFADILVARTLGAKEFGLFSYVLALVAIVRPISTAGLESLVVQDFASAPSFKDREIILNQAIALRLIGGVLSVLIIAILSFSLNSESLEKSKLSLILSIAVIFQASGAIEMLLQSQLEGKRLVGARLTAMLPASLFKIFLAFKNASIYAFAWSYILDFCLQAFTLGMTCFRQGFRVRIKEAVSFRTVKLLQKSFPFILSGFAITLYLKADSIMLGILSNDRELGLYSAAARISEGTYFISTVIMSSFAPLIYKDKVADQQLYKNRLNKMLGIQSTASICLLTILLTSAGYMIPLIYGIAYEDSVPIFVIHVISLPFVFLGIAASPIFIAEGFSKYVAYRSVLGALVNILLNFWLIPLYGGVGAAVATLVSYACSSLFMNLISQKTRFIFWLQLRSFAWLFSAIKAKIISKSSTSI